MGEEVREPRTTIPRAIVGALGAAVVVYTVVGVTLLMTLGLTGIGGSTTPLAAAVEGSPWAGVVVRVGASAAALGALLALIAGVGRTSLAMAREGDLPRWLSAVHPRYRVPHRAEAVLAVVVCVLVATVDLRGAIGFSSFGVLLYYAVANASAWTQTREHRLYPRRVQVLGLTACLVLVATLPLAAVLAGLAVLAVGLSLRAIRLRRVPR
jgi:APA family basic amino acid/polyamine antiporter